MSKLTDTQLIVMSRAAQREDGAAIVPDRLNRSAAMKIATSLVGRGLMEEVAGVHGMPVWRRDAEDRPVSLVITVEGRRAIGLDDDAPSSDVTRGEEPIEQSTLDAEEHDVGSPSQNATEAEGASADAMTDRNPPAPRAGSKQALLVGLLSRPQGATIAELTQATGWLPHTTLAALTRLRQSGRPIESLRAKGEPTLYRITQAEDAEG